jgi:hypothetical protein
MKSFFIVMMLMTFGIIHILDIIHDTVHKIELKYSGFERDHSLSWGKVVKGTHSISVLDNTISGKM